MSPSGPLCNAKNVPKRMFFSDNSKKSLLDGESPTNFKRDLTEYLISYKTPELDHWLNIIKGHDFSKCRLENWLLKFNIRLLVVVVVVRWRFSLG